MKSTITGATALFAIALLASCASHSDGRRMTLAEQWKAMADRQDAAARAFVDTGTADGERTQRGVPSEMPDRSARFTEMSSF